MTTIEAITEDLRDITNDVETPIAAESEFGFLGLDSLDRVELMLFSEERHGITIDEMEWSQAKTIGDAVAIIDRVKGLKP